MKDQKYNMNNLKEDLTKMGIQVETIKLNLKPEFKFEVYGSYYDGFYDDGIMHTTEWVVTKRTPTRIEVVNMFDGETRRKKVKVFDGIEYIEGFLKGWLTANITKPTQL